jgi:hypothetical protein
MPAGARFARQRRWGTPVSSGSVRRRGRQDMTTSLNGWNAQAKSDRQALELAGAFFGAGAFAAFEAAVYLNSSFSSSLTVGFITGSVALISARVWGGRAGFVVALVAWVAIAFWDVHGQ